MDGSTPLRFEIAPRDKNPVGGAPVYNTLCS